MTAAASAHDEPATRGEGRGVPAAARGSRFARGKKAPSAPGHDPLEVQLELRGPNRTVIVEGALDEASAPEFEDVLDDAMGGMDSRTIVDLGQATFIDAAGIRALLRANRIARLRSTRLMILPPPDDVQAAIEREGVADVLPFASLHETA